jgi:hypothetical protein
VSESDILETAGYRATLHWATARDGFDSVLSVYNYYGHAFRDAKPPETDSELTVQLFDEKGTLVANRAWPIETGETLHIRISKVVPGFRGLVAARMTPRGRMPRINRGSAQTPRPIATSYFMLYERQGGFRDLSHELFLARDDADEIAVEWASLIDIDVTTRPGIVVMNNRPLRAGSEFASGVEIVLGRIDGAHLAGPFRIALPPGGSAVVMIDDAFPDLALPDSDGGYCVIVRGNNIEQPMTLHLLSSGDFNVHHF